jgi:hypothetical protein
MRRIAITFAVLLGAVTVSAAIGQQAVTSTVAKTPTGLSFAFDAVHGQMSASGYTINPAPAATTTPTQLSGTIKVTLTVNLKSTFTTGTVIRCGAMAVGGTINTSTDALDGGIEGASSKATVSGTKATCTLSIPYQWNLVAITLPAAVESNATTAATSTTESFLLVAFAVGAVDTSGNVERVTLQLGDVSELPANGATTKLAYTTTI